MTGALALIGFSAAMAQILFMRELIVAFNGNEISLGIMLAIWLFWTAAGSSLCGVLGQGRRPARGAVAALECLLALSLPPTLWALRACKGIFQTVPGELVGPAPMLIASLACLSLFCVVSGALFVAAVRMYETECNVSARRAASAAYLLEAAGSALGGCLTGMVLLRFLDAFQIAMAVAIPNLCMATLLLFRGSRKRSWIAVAFWTTLAIPLLLWVAPSLDRAAQSRLWRGFSLLGSRDSIYGNLTVTVTGDIRSLYDNGAILANAPDPGAAEEAVHYALLEHAAPRRVLLIGGGVKGSIAEVLKHPTVERVDYVEMDPAIIAMARRFFPAQVAPIASDPRVRVHYADGRAYLMTARDSFDVIVLDVPDPQSAQLNRFYTVEFFLSAREHLAPGGLVALSLRSSEETISPDLAEYLRCIRRTLAEAFPYVVAIPGETMHLFGATRPGVLTGDPHTLIARLKERRIQTQYVREYFIPFRMMPDRMAQVEQQLRPLPSTPVNRDFVPIAYYFDVVLWSEQFKSGDSGWFRAAARIAFPKLLGAAAILLAIAAFVLAFVPRPRGRARCSALCCAGATGFTAMALQIIVLLAFQSIYGYVFHELTILIGLSMAGIGCGCWLGMRQVRHCHGAPYRAMAVAQFLLALSLPALILTATLLEQISGAVAIWMAAQFVFPALAALSGVLAGYQFPVAMEVYLHQSDARLRPATLYAVDLLGGCAGAFLLSTYLIPVFGFWKTAWLSAAVNLAAALIAARVSMEAKSSEP